LRVSIYPDSSLIHIVAGWCLGFSSLGGMDQMHKRGIVVPFRTVPATTSPTPLLNKFTSHVSQARTPDAILDALDDFASKLLPVNVLGVGRMPQRTSDWRSIQLGRDVFLHSSAPAEWWNEYAAKASQGYDPGIMMAKTSLMAYTWTETMQTLEPIGADRWPYELALKYGIRDALTCCVGQRWLVAYWSRQVLCNLLTHPLRILLIAAASFTALRLEQVVRDDPKRFAGQLRITPRELAVLRLVSLGMSSNEIAERLGIGEETVRSHLKKVQIKLGARNRAHAAAEAMRQQLIP
jgi:DNA-binding CsgD family transcriptional regulator